MTGAGSGFGEGIARTLCARGRASVVVNDRARRRTASVWQAKFAPPAARAIVLRRRRGEATPDVARLVRSALDDFGELDIVVNNAGTTHRNQPMLDVSKREFDRIYAVNVKSLYLTARHAVPHRRKGRRRFHHDRVDRRRAAAARTHLVQREQGRCDRHAAARWQPSLRPDRIRVNVINPVAGETAIAGRIHGRRYAGAARQVHRDDSATE